MFIVLIIAATAVAVLVLTVALFVQRGREAIDLSPRNLLQTYLYAASFAGLVALVYGLAALGNYTLARVAGDDFVYGSQALARPVAPACPPNVPGCAPPFDQQAELRRVADENERRRGEELLRGITFTVLGALFYGAHLAARRGAVGAEEPQSGLRRSYLMLGTAVFGLATIVLVPTGVYQALANAILPRSLDTFRPGVADSLAPGVVSLVVWLIFLRLVVGDFRRGPGARQVRAGGGGWHGGSGSQLTGVGAPRPTASSSRSAGAEAQPPTDDTEI